MLTTQSAIAARIPLAATLAVAASAAVLFAIEPFTGKVLLPRLGGSPSVWNTCVMVFQILLLAGYGYSVLVVRLADRRKAVVVHTTLVVASVVLWPILAGTLWLTPKPSWPPVLWIVATTMAGVGLPFALLSATSPLVQVWLARSSPIPLDVHRLYAVSNIASIAGLAAYVGALEPFVGVGRQSSVLWLGYAVAMILAIVVARSAGKEVPIEQGLPRVDLPDGIGSTAKGGSRGEWIAISFGASLCLYAVTTYITTDVASFPLLWCAPLGLFLAGFAMGFSSLAARFRVWLIQGAKVVALAALAHLVWVEDSRTLWVGLLAPLLTLACLVTALAAELAHRRPADDRLAGYYAWVGLGGVLAGTTCVILLPWAWSALSLSGSPLWSGAVQTLGAFSPVFLTESVPEYAAALLLTTWLLSVRSGRDAGTVALSVLLAVVVAGLGIRFLSPEWDSTQRMRIVGVAMGCAFLVTSWGTRMLAAILTLAFIGGVVRSPGRAALFEARNFFGTSRVEVDGGIHMLKHGTTLHGIQPVGDAASPASYYSWASPLGRVMERRHPKSVIAVGLGVGTVAAYGQQGDHYRFLEINPLVPRIAANPRWFSYVTDAKARGVKVEIAIGDGRLLAAGLVEGAWDLIIVDAFSSDAIPVHLLSLEAMTLFAHKASRNGIIAYHISNRFFDLEPVLAATATRLGLWWAVQSREGLTATDYRSTWVMMAKSATSAQEAGLTESGWEQPAVAPTVSPWTDDWANVLGTMKSWRFWKDEE